MARYIIYEKKKNSYSLPKNPNKFAKRAQTTKVSVPAYRALREQGRVRPFREVAPLFKRVKEALQTKNRSAIMQLLEKEGQDIRAFVLNEGMRRVLMVSQGNARYGEYDRISIAEVKRIFEVALTGFNFGMRHSAFTPTMASVMRNSHFIFQNSASFTGLFS